MRCDTSLLVTVCTLLFPDPVTLQMHSACIKHSSPYACPRFLACHRVLRVTVSCLCIATQLTCHQHWRFATPISWPGRCAASRMEQRRKEPPIRGQHTFSWAWLRTGTCRHGSPALGICPGGGNCFIAVPSPTSAGGCCKDRPFEEQGSTNLGAAR